MSWKLDNIAFTDYGVHVAKSAGVLDVPRIVDQSVDWLDEDGRDYWQDQASVIYDAREIVLNCWIKASGYNDFKTKVNAFYAALHATGTRTLDTVFGNSVENVVCQQSVSMVRKTSYVSSLQVGMFTLRLTVLGDTKLKYITVDNDGWPDANIDPILAPYSSDARLVKNLQGTWEISFSSEVNSPVAHGSSNHIYYGNEKFYAFDYPELTKLANNKFVYKLTFVHKSYLMKDVQFRVIDRSDTPWQSTLEDVVDMIVTNMNARFPDQFVKGTIETTESRNNQFTNESCWDVLVRMANEYEFEWRVKRREYSNLLEITAQKRIAASVGYGVTWRYGKGNELTKITRQVSSRENLCTRLYAYGSDKNIPVTYGYPRLKLPVEPILYDFYGMQIERTKIFDDIFPMRTGSVDSYVFTNGYTPEWIEWLFIGAEEAGYTFHPAIGTPADNRYEFIDSSMDFDLKELKADGKTTKYLIAGTTAKIHFNTGDLAGFEFEVLDYNHATKTFKLIPYTDAQKIVYPNETLYPRPGDEYKIIDINMPDSYIADAEDRLSTAANDWLNDLMNKNGTYVVETVPADYDNYQTILPGSTVILQDDDLGVDTTLRITDINTNIYTNISTITLSDIVKPGKIKTLESQVSAIQNAITAAKIDKPNTVAANAVTTSEINGKLIDKSDDKLNTDVLIRSKDITPRMLSVDAGTPQFSIEKAPVIVDPVNPNKITIKPGKLLNHSYKAIDKKSIQML